MGVKGEPGKYISLSVGCQLLCTLSGERLTCQAEPVEAPAALFRVPTNRNQNRNRFLLLSSYLRLP